MTSRDFCFWLQGYFEITGQTPQGLNQQQTAMVQRHLALVFKHEIDPSLGGNPSELQQIHDGPPIVFPHTSPSDTLIRC